MDKPVDYYRKDARNIVWGVAFVALIPAIFVLVMAFSGSRIKWDVVNVSILAYSATVSILAVIAGIYCGKGKKVGRILAFFPAILFLLNFPLGTIFGIATLVKINKRAFVNSLD